MKVQLKNLIFFVLAITVLSACRIHRAKLPSENRNIQMSKLADQVKAEFLHAWEGYKKYAWGHDELKPLSKGYRDWYKKPLLLTPVDAFSTMKIMELEKEARAAKQLILTELSFDIDDDVQLFEVNIRLLGGLLSAYQLDGDEGFIMLAVDLASRLIPCFNSATGMPYRYVNLKTGKIKDPVNNPAEIGTLLLEWGTLSKITGDPVYYQKARKALQALFERRSEKNLVGTTIDVETGIWRNANSHIGARIDSYYEYLLKSWLMFGDEDIKKMWEISIRAIEKYLAERTESGLWYGQTNMNTAERTGTLFGALEAFFPAVLALSGDLERAKELQNSCYRMWMLFGIEPERIDYSTMEAISDFYILRPENIESAFYLYYYTKDFLYQRMGKEYFESLVRYCRNEVAYSHLESVQTKKQHDAMQSFFLAETLKYLYLIFAPEGTINLDTVIFNTEAHPLKIWR